MYKRRQQSYVYKGADGVRYKWVARNELYKIGLYETNYTLKPSVRKYADWSLSMEPLKSCGFYDYGERKYLVDKPCMVGEFLT